MALLLDELLARLQPDNANLDEVCAAIAQAVRENPTATSMWPMLIEARMKKHVSLTIGRALMDAVSTFDSEKTMWLMPATSSDATNAPLPKAQPPEHVTTVRSIEQAQALFASDRRHDVSRTVGVLPPPAIGTLVNHRYLLERQLGYGCLGQIFSAADLAVESVGIHRSHVIIEVIAVDLQRDPQALTELQKTVSRSKQLRHPNIVRVYGVEHSGGRASIVMEPMSGCWLGDLIRRANKAGLPAENAWSLIEGIASGLAHAHQQGIVHSALNPYSIFVTDAGVPKIMGFDLVVALPTSNQAIDVLDTLTLHAYSEAYVTRTNTATVTAHPADDLYPLGVMAYELMTGEHPFLRHSLSTARDQRMACELIPALMPRAAKLIAQCLSFERTKRPDSAMQFLQRLQSAPLLRRILGAKYSKVFAA